MPITEKPSDQSYFGNDSSHSEITGKRSINVPPTNPVNRSNDPVEGLRNKYRNEREVTRVISGKKTPRFNKLATAAVLSVAAIGATGNADNVVDTAATAAHTVVDPISDRLDEDRVYNNGPQNEDQEQNARETDEIQRRSDNVPPVDVNTP